MPNTVISSAAVNSDFSDIADALTESLARDGQGGMQAVLPMDATGFTYNNDTNTGMYRTGADAQAIKCGGIDIVDINSTGIDVTGAVKQNGFSVLPVGLGPLPWSGTVAPSGWLLALGQSLVRSSYPALWAFAQAEIALSNTLYTNGNGTTTFTIPDLRGRVPAGIGGTAAGRLTSTYFGSDPDALGDAGGLESNTLSVSTLPSHDHGGATGNQTASTTARFFYSGNVYNPSGATPVINQLSGSAGPGAIDAIVTNHQHTIPAQGGGTPHANVQPTLITNYIIFAGV